jgi:hypothetical protein
MTNLKKSGKVNLKETQHKKTFHHHAYLRSQQRCISGFGKFSVECSKAKPTKSSKYRQATNATSPCKSTCASTRFTA